MRTQNTLRTLAGGLALGALTVGAFAWGHHLGPENHGGRDLYRAQAPAPMKTAFGGAPLGLRHNVVLASAQTGAGRDSAGQSALPADTDSDDLNGDSPAATFQQIYVLLKRNYVEGVPDDSKLGHGAAEAMVASLQDPHCRFLEPAQFAALQREQKGQYDGIGAALAVRTRIQPKAVDDPTRDKDHPDNTSYELTVIAPVPGGPADKAGLKTGDVITDINGQWIATYDLVSAQAKELKAAQDKNDPVALNKLIDTLQKKLDNAVTLAQAETKLSDPNAKPLTLTVSRPGQPAPLTVTVTPGTVPALTPVSGRTLAGGVGDIKISQFGPDTAAAFDAALSSLGPDVKSLVLDLRGATGGSLDAASAVASRLTTARTLGYERTKGDKVAVLPITPAKAVLGPVAVLVNGGTDNVAELLAAALQGGGAKLIGSETFGDAAVVKPVALRDGSGFTMTVGEFQTASKAAFGGVGVKPDTAVPEAPGADQPLAYALMELSGRVARIP